MFYSTYCFLFLVAVSVQSIGALITSACYGTDPTCVFYEMECEPDKLVRISALNVGYKNDSVSLKLYQH